MKRGWLLAAVAGASLTLAAATGLAQTGTQAKPDTARTQQIVTQVCAACHGVEGLSVASANPHLAGQHAEYVARQLDHFKSGLRKNAVTPGDLRIADIFELLPFENKLVALEVTGAQLMNVLKAAVTTRSAQSGARLIYRMGEDKKPELISAKLRGADGKEADAQIR